MKFVIKGKPKYTQYERMIIRTHENKQGDWYKGQQGPQ